ncbi:cytidine deaminase [Marinomonas sp. SBI22]|jgi:cytidine deaminase|uniref:cytidine deaminase n=1 Tax=unclassified Marinomonas TaxID=196814 RepID=UPI0007AF5CF0|nr:MULTISPECIES: cytidine deaminase [unclassified Marinomonas]KZM40367.1 cytidine deaminase [Marinomonas sp. SBI22]KZM41784.1 cytidine deaminase [Marinomonas sp. SBI8L]
MSSLDVKKAVELANKAMSKAYVPYSEFKVGAVIETLNGKVYSGCNVENAAYPEGTCAEAGAISAMVLDGEQKIDNIYVLGNGEQLVTPCGGCRQKIREFSTPDTQIHICGPEGVRKTLSMEELLPFSFGPENLKK